MSLRPADFALNDTRWNTLVAIKAADETGRRYVVTDLQTGQARAVADLDPFGGMPELEDKADA